MIRLRAGYQEDPGEREKFEKFLKEVYPDLEKYACIFNPAITEKYIYVDRELPKAGIKIPNL